MFLGDYEVFMTNLHLQSLPFIDFGPSNKFWLEAIDPTSRLHEFLPVGVLNKAPYPEARLKSWQQDGERRHALSEAFVSLGLPYSEPQSKAIQELLDPDCVVVVTGQQPGALGGPLYTFSKILSAVSFSSQLRQEWKVPVIPILWDGGDDHDLGEVDDVVWPRGEEGISHFHFGIGEGGARPAWKVSLNEAMYQAWEKFLESVHPATEYRTQFNEWFSGLWHESYSWCDLFDRFWLRIFENHPLLIVRPWEMPFRKMARDVMAAEIADPTVSMEAVAETTARIATTGYKPQVHKKSGVCNFFFLQEEGRRSVTYEEGFFRIDGIEAPVPKHQLLEEYHHHPERFSPNALLRPVLQDAILPSAVSVLGPSEIAYHAQLQGLYLRHSTNRSWIIPRLSITFATSGQIARMEEMGLSWGDLKRDEAELAKNLTATVDEDPALVDLRGLVIQLQQTREKVIGHLREGRQHLIEPADSQLGRVEKTMHQIQDLLLRDAAKRDATRVARIRSLKINLLPEGNLQERIYGLPLLLCRHGFDWIESILENTSTLNGESHFVITLGT
jgi:bacillithiol synthase